MLFAFKRRLQHFLGDLVYSAKVNVEVPLYFETSEADVTSEDFILLVCVFLLHVGQRAAVVREAGVTQ